jgi:hypothetical protein
MDNAIGMLLLCHLCGQIPQMLEIFGGGRTYRFLWFTTRGAFA